MPAIYSIPRLILTLLVISGFVLGTFVFVTGRYSETTNLPSSPLHRASLSSLENRYELVGKQLHSLPKPSTRTGVGAVGYRSQTHLDADQPEWIRIVLPKPTWIDQVVLVPMIWRDTQNGFRADGFPLKFSIRVGNGDSPAGTKDEGKVVAAFGPEQNLLPRVAPVVISIPAVEVTWVQLDVATLSPRGWDGLYILQLSEILVFSGLDNVALRQKVIVSSTGRAIHGLPRHPDYLVDGFVPYLMDAFEGEQSLSFLSENCIGKTPTISIDLGKAQPVSGIHLHATELSDNVPQALPNDFGIPRRTVIEGAMKSDFSDAIHLCDYQVDSIYDVGPIIMRRFPTTNCRYVRFIAVEPKTYNLGGEEQSRIGFAEIEVLSKGVNVALHQTARVDLDGENANRSATTLTDGNNLFGKILPIRQWLYELEKRHELEMLRPQIAAELTQRYRRQRQNFVRLSWLAGLLAFIVVCTILVERIIRQRAILWTRERIAADLHDELGANLHAIGLLGDLAQASADSPKQLKSVLQRIRALTERSGAATRHCANLLESDGLFSDLMEDMKRTSTRLMADLDHELSFDGEDQIRNLDPSIRIDLFLFYQECLINILKHSHATRVVTKLKADQNGLSLTVTDNGCGLQQSVNNQVPKSLRRRAKLARAHVLASQPADGGTQIALKMRTKKRGMIK